jgi:hypothetical protein
MKTYKQVKKLKKKKSNVAAVVGRRKCRTVLTKAAVHIQRREGDFLHYSYRKYRNDHLKEVSQPFLTLLTSLYCYFSPSF